MPTSAQPSSKYTQMLLTGKSLYDSYLSPQLPAPVATIIDTLFDGAIQAQPYISQMTSLFTSLISKLSGASGGSAESTALISTAITILTLYLSLRVMNYFRRMVMGWVIFGIKLLVFLVGAQVIFYINKYGWENAIRDASWWGGLAWGFLEELLEGNQDGAKAPKGTRSRAGAKRGGYQGREQVPVGARKRWT